MNARVDELVRAERNAWRPPPRLSLSQWADEHFFLSAESSAEPGRWRTLPYQRAILDAFTDPAVEQVSVIKSARVGWTKCMNVVVAYYMAQDPCPIMVVQPTIEDAEGYSKEEIAPMVRDVPVLAALIPEAKARDSGQTLLHKAFPGGSISMVGANSGRGFRRVSRKVVLFDEVDGYPPSAGTEGDQIKLGIRRTEYYWDRKIGAGSTPLVAGASRIEDLFEKGDQRRYFVPCPHCGHMDFLAFREGPQGHFMKWPDGRPREAHFVCSKNGCVIEHEHKRAMVEAGEWRAAAPFTGHASFHVWAAYSYSPNASWGQLAEEFVDANKGGPEMLKTFVNTTLGETWQDRGEAPDWLRLYQRREPYSLGAPPAGVQFLTAGVDVQKDRLVWEVVGWGAGKQSWSVDSGVIPGDTSSESGAVWSKLDELLGRTWVRADGQGLSILMLAIDSGYNTQTVYNWARHHPMSRVIASKGVPSARVLIGTPTPVDVTVRGKRLARGYKVWPVGVNVAKSELYGWLRLEAPTAESGEDLPAGWCHFPEYGEEYFKQLTAEHLVPVVKRSGFKSLEWQILPGRENHYLDCRVYARAAAALCGLDRMVAPRVTRPAAGAAPSTGRAAEPERTVERPQETEARPKGTWLGDGPGRRNWLRRR
jgi:phage terminase large subunit GpA-like protein